MSEPTRDRWVADVRGGCAAVYPAGREGDTPGLHRDDARNIWYSNEGAHFDGMYWELPESVEATAHLIASAPDLLVALEASAAALDPCVHAYRLVGDGAYADHLQVVLDAARAALAKARGGS